MAENKPKTPFTPEILPVNLDYSLLVEDIKKAHIALVRLDETLRHIPNPSLLERTFLTREAVLSSMIEGTQVTLEEVLKKDAEDGERVRKQSDSKTLDYVEVYNYRRALRQGVTLIDSDESLGENNVKKLHQTLLRSVRGASRAPGEFRKKQVWIGPPGTPMSEARYIPPEPTKVPELYGNFDRYLNVVPSAEKDALVQIAVAHYQFEAIHPFEDGNGRIGRLLIPLFLYKNKILAHPLVYISQYFERHRRDYYDLLADVSYQDGWIPWIRFFLNGLCEQANDASDLARQIIAMREEYRTKLIEMNSAYAFGLLDALFMWPIFTTVNIKGPAGIKNTQTLISLLEKFERHGMIRNWTPERQRGRTYAFQPLLDLLDKKRDETR